MNIKYNAYDYENKVFIWNIKYISIVDSHLLKAEMHRIKYPKNDKISFEVLEESLRLLEIHGSQKHLGFYANLISIWEKSGILKFGNHLKISKFLKVVK